MIPGCKELLNGDSGAGKTYSIRTWIAAGVTPYIIFMDQQGLETMGDVPGMGEKWFYRLLKPGLSGWDTQASLARDINAMQFEGLANKRGIDKAKHAQWLDLIACSANFTDEQGRTHGDVTTWGTDRVFVNDGLTGLSDMAMGVVLGAQPVRSPADYGVAMNLIDTYLAMCCHGMRCHYLLIAHPELEADEIAGQKRVMVATLGRKLAPTLPRYFSDVILAKRSAKKFYWSTDEPSYVLKAKNLQISNEIQPSFAGVVEAWRKRGGVIQATEVKATK